MSKLHHEYCENLELFFKRIDEYGGWPCRKKFVAYQHSNERKCEFMNEYVRNGWWTTVCSSDDYYTWKLSQKAIHKIKAAAYKEMEHIIYGLRFPKKG